MDCFVWPKCTDATLEVGTEQAGKYITVNSVTAQQVLDICKADNYTQRVRMANDIAMINAATAVDVSKQYVAKDNIDYDLLMPNKPVLTATEKTEQLKSDNTLEQTNLTIMVIRK